MRDVPSRSSNAHQQRFGMAGSCRQQLSEHGGMYFCLTLHEHATSHLCEGEGKEHHQVREHVHRLIRELTVVGKAEVAVATGIKSSSAVWWSLGRSGNVRKNNNPVLPRVWREAFWTYWPTNRKSVPGVLPKPYSCIRWAHEWGTIQTNGHNCR